MVKSTDVLTNIIREPKLLESDDEDQKNDASSDDEGIMYMRRDSQQSNASSKSTSSVDSTSSEASAASSATNPGKEQAVDDLSDKLNTLQVDTEDKPGCKVDSLTEKLKTSLKVQDDDNVVERSPMGHDFYGNRRRANAPYPQQQNYMQVNHYGGGILPQNEYNQLEQLNNLPLPDQFNNLPLPEQFNNRPLPELSGNEVSEILNNLARPTLAEPPTVDFSVLNPVQLELPNVDAVSSTAASFSTRRASPAPSSSPDRNSAYSSDVFSPQSCTSVDTDSSLAVGSPYSQFDLTSLNSHSPARSEDLPTVLCSSSEDESKKKEAISALRQLIDAQYMEIKKYEWIKACQKDQVEELFSDLRKLLTESRFSNRRLVKIYATIAIILKREGRLRQFFMEEPQILSHVAMKNNPLLLRYIIETMQNLRLTPEAIENPVVVLRKVIEHNQNMTEMLQTLLSVRNVHNLPVFDVNQPDEEGLTAIHYVLHKIKQMENSDGQQLSLNYLKMFLETQPDLTFRTRSNNRTYLHHAVAWGCAPEAVRMILYYAQQKDTSQTFNLVDEVDSCGDSALKLAATLTQGRKEIEDVLQQFGAFNIYQQYDPNNIYEDLDPLSQLLNNS